MKLSALPRLLACLALTLWLGAGRKPGVSGQTCGSRTSARLLTSIPCDMSYSIYCSIPGSAYPWHSVRRYIFENQGLMRRMYGVQRQSVIMGEEMETGRQRYDTWETVRMAGGRAAPAGLGPLGSRLAPSQHPTSSSSSSVASSVPPLSSPSTTDMTETDPEDFVQEWLPYLDPFATSESLPFSSSTESQTHSASSTGSSPPNNSTPTTTMTTAELVTPPTKANATNPATFTTTATTAQSTVVPGSAGVTEKVDTSPPLFYADDDDLAAKVSIISSNTVDSGSEPPKNPSTTDGKGVNACAVREEVIAPYWANNTRGETLALLNVYPFEQYIHSEKCAYENHQMFCREGCRCEQQFRLHRLLAFDPKNECRGIFADWFRFPSCCICICYNVPRDPSFKRIRTGRDN